MYVRDWMSSPAVTIAPEASVAAALALMRQHRIRRLPVLEGDRLVGIVSRNDLAARTPPGSWKMRRSVGHLMNRNPVAVAPEDTVESAARILLRKKFSGLPVVADGRVEGMITESDLFRAICRMLGIVGRGARMEVSLRDDRALLEYLSHRMSDFKIRNLITIPDPEGGWKLVLRVRGLPTEKKTEVAV